jgi:hypothetical protein
MQFPKIPDNPTDAKKAFGDLVRRHRGSISIASIMKTLRDGLPGTSFYGFGKEVPRQMLDGVENGRRTLPEAYLKPLAMILNFDARIKPYLEALHKACFMEGHYKGRDLERTCLILIDEMEHAARDMDQAKVESAGKHLRAALKALAARRSRK